MEATLPQNRTLLREKPPAEVQTGIENVSERSTTSGPEARDTNHPEEVGEAPSGPAPSSTAWRDNAGRLLRAVGRRLSTLAIALVALASHMAALCDRALDAEWQRPRSSRKRR